MDAHRHEYTREVSQRTHSVKPTPQCAHSVKPTPVELSGWCRCIQTERRAHLTIKGALRHHRGRIVQLSSITADHPQFVHCWLWQNTRWGFCKSQTHHQLFLLIPTIFYLLLPNTEKLWCVFVHSYPCLLSSSALFVLQLTTNLAGAVW